MQTRSLSVPCSGTTDADQDFHVHLRRDGVARPGYVLASPRPCDRCRRTVAAQVAGQEGTLRVAPATPSASSQYHTAIRRGRSAVSHLLSAAAGAFSERAPPAHQQTHGAGQLQASSITMKSPPRPADMHIQLPAHIHLALSVRGTVCRARPLTPHYHRRRRARTAPSVRHRPRLWLRPRHRPRLWLWLRPWLWHRLRRNAH